MLRFLTAAAVGGLILIMSATDAVAQQADVPFRLPTPSRWGVEASVTPYWFTPDGGDSIQDLYCSMLAAGSNTSACTNLSLAGSDVRIGFVRGRARGGEWGIAYLRRRFRDDSAIRTGISCDPASVAQYLSSGGGSFTDDCALFGGSESNSAYYYEFRNVTLSGPEFHWSFPFTTIAERVQLGVTGGVGIGSFKGTAEGFSVLNSPSTPSFGQQLPTFSPSTIQVPDELLHRWQFLLRADFDVSVRIARGLKLRSSAGLDWQGMHIGNISVLYFFGDE